MNRIEELHDIAQQESILKQVSHGIGQSRTMEAKAHAAVTADVAVKFLEYVRDNGYYYHDPEYGPKGWTTSLFKNGVTTTELFNSEEFQKTL